jgi:hypothetical protein
VPGCRGCAGGIQRPAAQPSLERGRKPCPVSSVAPTHNGHGAGWPAKYWLWPKADRGPGHPKPMGAGPRWGIDTIASPWLAAAIGAVHRSQPVPDLEDMAVVFVLALMTPDTQHTYMREFERFRPGSLRLDRIIEQLASEIGAALPEVIAQFLTACKETGVPR